MRYFEVLDNLLVEDRHEPETVIWKELSCDNTGQGKIVCRVELILQRTGEGLSTNRP